MEPLRIIYKISMFVRDSHSQFLIFRLLVLLMYRVSQLRYNDILHWIIISYKVGLLCTVGCLTTSLASTHYPPQSWQSKVHFNDILQEDNIAPPERLLIYSGNIKHHLSIILGYLSFFQFLIITSKIKILVWPQLLPTHIAVEWTLECTIERLILY